jgi:hypothetical protein
MKLRHAAALALLGWYLMMPPVTNDNHPDPAAALSTWQNVAAYDSALDCQRALGDMKDALGREETKQEYREGLEGVRRSSRVPLSYSDFMQRAENSQCVSADDPRLKP